jgi:D-3-phosphoglycerate dehydrogenase / 2-oxoglutarate reductase
MNILVTCPPMIQRISEYDILFQSHNLHYHCPTFKQTMTEEELIKLVPKYDGWIIGDDPATEKVFSAGVSGRLKAAVKWGVGVDNVDFNACKALGIPITNVPNVFGEEVSDVAIGMMLNLSRKLHLIDAETKKGNWYKPCGSSLSGKKACLIGFGNIGQSIARKLLAFQVSVYAFDPFYDVKTRGQPSNITLGDFNTCMQDADYIFIACALTETSKHLIRRDTVKSARHGVRIINVARGPIVKESDIVELLEEGFVHAVGFDVFEEEPLPMHSKLRDFPQNIYGSHNGSNTVEAVDRTSNIAVERIVEFLKNKISENC